MSYYMADRKHRKAFLEARQSLEVKMNLEEQSQQQASLLWGGRRPGSGGGGGGGEPGPDPAGEEGSEFTARVRGWQPPGPLAPRELLLTSGSFSRWNLPPLSSSVLDLNLPFICVFSPVI